VTSRSRWTLGVAALGLLAGSAWHGLARLQDGRELEALLADTGLARRQPAVVEAVRAEPDPVRARLLVARALLVEAVDQSSFSALPIAEAVAEASRVGERLEIAESLARAAVVARPAAWQASMALGAARYLAWSRSGDKRLLANRDAWEEPLQDALRRAPDEEEVRYLYAVTRIEIWAALDSGEQVAARQVLRQAFESEDSFRRLLRPWFAVAGSREAAWSLVPRRASAWQVVASEAAGTGDWEVYLAARARQREVQLDEATAALAEAERRLVAGDAAGGRGLALQVVGQAPLDRAGAALVTQAVAMLPPGLAGAPWSVFAPWVERAGAALARGVPGLDASTVARMIVAADGQTPAEQALAWLAAGNLEQAELVERRAEGLSLEAWAPFFLAKARILAGRGELASARAALVAVNRNVAPGLAAARARAAVAECSSDPNATAAAQEVVTRLGAARWDATAWRWHRGVATLEIQAAAVADALHVAVDAAPEAGAVVALQVDDEPSELAIARPSTSLAVRGPLAAGYHILTVTRVVGGQVRPGEVSLGLSSH
jgi:hypothetical protein